MKVKVLIFVMLSKIELYNFKNIAGKRVIQIWDSLDSYAFSVIVGRNGSGKSCILEAVEWVLYDTNRKDLRAQNLDQLIHASAATKYVEVSLTLFVLESGYYLKCLIISLGILLYIYIGYALS